MLSRRPRWSRRCEPRSFGRRQLRDEIATALPNSIVSISLRTWPPDFPGDIAVQRRAPYEARADAIMYRQVLAEVARGRGWEVRFYAAKDVVGHAISMLGARADEVLHGPRAVLGPPWTKDHRMALAATIVGAEAPAETKLDGPQAWPPRGGGGVPRHRDPR